MTSALTRPSYTPPALLPDGSLTLLQLARALVPSISLIALYAQRSIILQRTHTHSSDATMGRELTKVVFKPSTEATEEFMVIVNPDEVRIHPSLATETR